MKSMFTNLSVWFGLVFALLVAAGCSANVETSPEGTTLNCSSEDAYLKSIARMSPPLTADERMQLVAAIMNEAKPGIQAAVKAGDLTKAKPHLAAKHLHGKTAKEILALATKPE
jgi:hypothetical protein